MALSLERLAEKMLLKLTVDPRVFQIEECWLSDDYQDDLVGYPFMVEGLTLKPALDHIKEREHRLVAPVVSEEEDGKGLCRVWIPFVVSPDEVGRVLRDNDEDSEMYHEDMPGMTL